MTPHERANKLSPLDRWERTPLDDAYSSEQPDCVKVLLQAGAHRGAGQNPGSTNNFRVLSRDRQNSSTGSQSARMNGNRSPPQENIRNKRAVYFQDETKNNT